MQLRHLKPIMPPTEGMCKVTALAWSPNNRRLAVVTVDRVVHLFDENGERRDKFSTKPAEKVRARGAKLVLGNTMWSVLGRSLIPSCACLPVCGATARAQDVHRASDGILAGLHAFGGGTERQHCVCVQGPSLGFCGLVGTCGSLNPLLLLLCGRCGVSPAWAGVG